LFLLQVIAYHVSVFTSGTWLWGLLTYTSTFVVSSTGLRLIFWRSTFHFKIVLFTELFRTRLLLLLLFAFLWFGLTYQIIFKIISFFNIIFIIICSTLTIISHRTLLHCFSNSLTTEVKQVSHTQYKYPSNNNHSHYKQS
jgi:hypothetical protein